MCQHTNTILLTTGSLRFIGGEVVDTIHEAALCLTCGAEVEPPAPQFDADDNTEDIPF